MKKYLFLLAAFLGALGIGLFWFGGFIDKRINEAHAAGKAECEAEYNKNAIQNNFEIEAKTQEVLKYKKLLKEQRKDLSDDCKTIYNIDLSICRQQLRQN